MGRRPSALVVEFFDRGPKIADSSNRYQHTCKRCGEVFPRGRVEALVRHLLRKCPQVTPQDRQTVFRHISSSCSQQESSFTYSKSLLQQREGSESSLAPYQKHEQSALDTLAEVSRRHLDYSSPTTSAIVQDNCQGKSLSEILAEQAMMTEPSSYDSVAQPISLNDNPHAMAPTTLDAMPLVQAANAASQRLDLAQAVEDPSGLAVATLDPQLDRIHLLQQPLDGIAEVGRNFGIEDFPVTTEASGMTFIPQRVKRLKNPPTVPPGHPTPGFGLLQQPKVSKRRKLFDKDRRQQVSDIRKQGACIRCRMLRKPCSPETPCNTCRAVQSARVWKSKCLRTRLADEFTLWSQCLFETSMYAALSAADLPSNEDKIVGKIHARLPTDPVEALTFPVVAHGEFASGGGESTFSRIMLNDEETTFEQLAHNIGPIVDYCIKTEQSAFMKATLKQAQTLLEDPNSEEIAAGATNRSPVSRYHLHGSLLRNVVNLWALTQVLVLPKKRAWIFLFEPAEGWQTDSLEVDIQHVHQGQTSETVSTSSQAHSLLVSQLLTGIEVACSKISKTVHNELERRLLQRQQVSPFATFLSSVILLACVERMTAYFQLFDRDCTYDSRSEYPVENTSLDNVQSFVDELDDHDPFKSIEDFHAPLRHQQATAWLLGEPPRYYWSQGANFAELLTMLLRIRALPPRTIVTLEGTLTVDNEPACQMRIGGRPLNENINEQTKAAAAWLNPLRLSVTDLIAQRDSQTEQGMEAWEMKFVAPLILPEHAR